MGRPRKDLSELGKYYRMRREEILQNANERNSEVVDGLPIGRIRLMLMNAKNRSKAKGIEFSLEVDDITPASVCPLLGIEICYFNKNLKANSPSLDRIDPRRGYTPDNVWIISHKANAAKNDLSIEQLEMLVANLRAEIERRET